ncbi:MAG: hypothetical protein ACR2PM_20170 [Hyphomicrobiales bacterium]
MVLIRILAILFWIGCIFTFGLDLWNLVDTGSFSTKSLGRWWFALDKSSLTFAQNFIERYVWEPLWNPGMVTLLKWPAWAVFAGFGFVLSWVSRKTAST